MSALTPLDGRATVGSESGSGFTRGPNDPDGSNGGGFEGSHDGSDAETGTSGAEGSTRTRWLPLAVFAAVVAVLFGVLAVLQGVSGRLVAGAALALAALFLLLTLTALLVAVRAMMRERALDRLRSRREWRAEINDLLAETSGYGLLPRLSEVSDEAFGIAANRYGDRTEAPYIQRPAADQLLTRLLSTSESPYPFVIVVGDAQSGKSRTSVEAIRKVYGGRNPAVIIPRNGRALVELVRLRPPPPVDPAPAIVWLDDIDGPSLDHLSANVLEELSRWAVVVATIQGRRYQQIRRAGADVTATAQIALAQAERVELDAGLTREEAAEAQWTYPNEDFGGSIGEALIGAGELLTKYRDGGQANPPGLALVSAAIDWRRAGMVRPITRSELRQLFPLYLREIDPGVAPTARHFATGLAWATEPVTASTALLEPAGDGWGPLGYLVAVDDAPGAETGRPIPRFLWDELLATVDPPEKFGLAVAAYLRGDHDAAAKAFRDSATSGASSHRLAATVGLGMALSRLGENDGARSAFHSVIEAGHSGQTPKAALNLGLLLGKQGDVLGARHAYEQAITSGHRDHGPRAAFSLGLLLARHGDTAGAEAAFEQALHSRHPDAAPSAAVGLGGVLRSRGDLAGAREYYEKAIRSNHPDAAALAWEMLSELPPEQYPGRPPEQFHGQFPAQAPGLSTPQGTWR